MPCSSKDDSKQSKSSEVKNFTSNKVDTGKKIYFAGSFSMYLDTDALRSDLIMP